MSVHVLSRGTIFAARYRVERCIGSGGMGAVYEAEHLDTERKVALKVMLPQALVTDGHRERFKQEARVAGRIRHPNIVDVLDAGVDDMTNMPYLVMELLEGEDLASRVERLGPMMPDEAALLLQQIGSALDCLHDRQIVHRDLKPENLFLTVAEDGSTVVKLLDFGVAKVIAEGLSAAFTQDAHGTPVYMAPEQFAEQIRISPATDIYALGMLAFTVLTGKHYWGAEIERGMNVFMLARVAEAGPKEPATQRARRAGTPLPAAFDEWFATVTAILPNERYPTAGLAVETLAEALNVPLAADRSQRTRAQVMKLMLAAPPGPPAPAARSSMRSPVHVSVSTPPIPLKRAQPLWKRRSIMTALVIGVSLIVAALIVVRGAPPRGGDAPAAPSNGTTAAAPSNAAAVASSNAPGAAPSSAPPPTSASSAAPSSSARASASSAPSSTTARRPPGSPPAGSTKRPLYTRE